MNDHAAEQAFYETLGKALSDLVVVGSDGVAMNGHITLNQLAPIAHAYATYLDGGNPVTADEDVEELESEISADASKLYDLKHEKFIDIEVPPESETDLHLFVTIGQDESPPDDEAEEEADVRPDKG